MNFELRSHSALWQVLGDPPPIRLTDARLQIHWAAQLLTAVATRHVPAKKDDSHTNLGWNHTDGLLLGKFTATPRPFQVALRPADLHLILRVAGGSTVAWYSLNHRTLDQARLWLSQEIRDFTGDAALKDLALPTYDLPNHPVHGAGAAFSLKPGDAFQELSHWYSAADATLQLASSLLKGASDVRCWPHHFDIATLVKIEPDEGSKEDRFIGIGMSPGDGSYDEPYFYINPHPAPGAKAKLPPLPEGAHWHRDGWTGAVLPGSQIVAAADENDRADRVTAYFDAALAACREILGVVETEPPTDP